jgi:DNA-binding CsgD family transcriptional regulator
MPDENPNDLSARELEILKLVATGASNKEIAQKLYISLNTVKVHIRNIFTKINAASRTEAAMYAVRIGLVENVAPQLQTADDENNIGNNPRTTIDGKSDRSQNDQAATVAGRRHVVRNIGIAILVTALIVLGSIYIPKNISGGNTPIPPTATTPVQWYELPGPPTPRQGLAVVNYENILYTIGGDNSTAVSNIVEAYNPQTHLWSNRSAKPTPVSDINAAVIGGLIYVPGGRLASGLPTDATDIYNPQQDQWTTGTSMPIALSAYSLAVYEGKMYVFGGWDGTKVTNNVYVFDPDKKIWTTIAPMPTARSYSGAVLVGNKIYVIGGWDGKQALTASEVFQPESSNPASGWSQAPPLHSGRYGMGIANIADIIFIIGGNTSNTDSTTIAFIPEETDWGDVENPIKSGWIHLGATNVGSRLYALGGMFDEQLNNQMWSYKVLFSIVLPILPK